MKHLFCTFLLLLATNLLFGQSSLDLKDIEKQTNDSSSAYFYPRLQSEFNNQPKLFDSEKAKYLYYGKIYTKNYKMYHISTSEIEFDKHVSKRMYKKATPFGEYILQENPTNIGIIAKLNTCYKKTKLTEKAEITLKKLDLLMNTVLESGTGMDQNNAFKVVEIGDEYAIMGLIGVVGLSRKSLMKGDSTIDTWEVRDSKSGRKYDMHFELLLNTELGFKNMK